MIVERVGLALKRNGTDPADVYLEPNGSLALVYNAEAVGQHARQRLMAWLGEWFLDRNVGVPWVRDLLGGLYDPVLAESVIKAEILNTDGVTGISGFSVSFALPSRGVIVKDITVETEYDQEANL